MNRGSSEQQPVAHPVQYYPVPELGPGLQPWAIPYPYSYPLNPQPLPPVYSPYAIPRRRYQPYPYPTPYSFFAEDDFVRECRELGIPDVNGCFRCGYC